MLQLMSLVAIWLLDGLSRVRVLWVHISLAEELEFLRES